MTLTEIMAQVDDERRFGSRFPIRIIFCNTLESYRTVVSQLSNRCDEVIQLADYCSGHDTHPRFRKLRDYIDMSEGKHFLLLSVGEYLRMAIRRECVGSDTAQFRSFWTKQKAVDSHTRVFVPIFDATAIFERVVGTVDPRQEVYLWHVEDSDTQEYSVTVCADTFADAFTEDTAIIGFKNWLLNWETQLSGQNATLVTARHEDCENAFGKLSISVIRSPYEFLSGEIPAIRTIEQKTVSDSYWARLFKDYQIHRDIDSAILSALHFKDFDSSSIASLWETLDPYQRWYAWLWYKLHTPDDYVGTILSKLNANELDNVASHIANDIIMYFSAKPEWVSQRRGILQGLKNTIPSGDFFNSLSSFLPKTAIQMLTSHSHEERTQIIKSVCRWLRTSNEDSDTIAEICSTVQPVFSDLVTYLSNPVELYGDFADYFEWYKRKKILNRPVNQMMSHPALDDLPSRYALLSSYDGKDCKALWIDGLGAEWLSLICFHLNNQQGITYTTNIATSRLPSETEYNTQWAQNDFEYVKRDRLDKLSHNGMPDDNDYFSCVDNQIRIVTELIQEALSYLNNHQYVIITGDHGSSRLAALAFHDLPAVYLPQGATAMAHGRFCKLTTAPKDADYLPYVEHCKIGEDDFLVMKDYNHYLQRGNAAGGNTDDTAVAGELHGGYTPEEAIVPVIVISRTHAPSTIIYTLPDTLKKSGGKACVDILFSDDVYSLEVDTTCGKCRCEKGNNSKTWKLFFTELNGEDATLNIYANGKLLPQKNVRITTSGIGKGSMGGLP